MTGKVVIGRGGAVLLAVALTPGLALAHGIERTGQTAPKPKSVESIWDHLISRAKAAAHITVNTNLGYRNITADGIPDHAPGQFPNRGNPHSIKSQSYVFRVPLNPQPASRTTKLGHNNFGVALNGVPFDALTAEFWNRDRSSGWNYEALSGKLNLGLDRHNAHVQPTGAYHYHGIPTGLLERFPYKDRPALLGYAADGFPIYGPFGHRDPADPSSPMVELKPSFRIKSGARPSGPGGAHDGTFVEDYEFASGLGDLDSCNGRTGVTPEYPDGTYHYVLTAAFPFIPRCWIGDPDPSFKRTRGTPPGGGHMGGGPRRPGGGFAGPPRRGGPGGRPDLGEAASRLGISRERLRRALGPPPPDLRNAARELGISVDELRRALHPPR